MGLMIKIKSAPTPQPINAPKIGINAVNAISTAIKSAYGNRKIVITTKNIAPNIIASRHCPVRKLENVLLFSNHKSSIFWAKMLFIGGGYAIFTIFYYLCSK